MKWKKLKTTGTNYQEDFKLSLPGFTTKQKEKFIIFLINQSFDELNNYDDGEADVY